ncbi:MAG: hypothetical protein AAB699_01475 [Patescibacteria group bacterium]
MFGSDKISRKEFRRALYKLRTSGGFSNHEIDEVQNVFYSSLNESGSSAGISSEELKKGIRYLKEHRGNHHLSSEETGKLEETLKRYL